MDESNVRKWLNMNPARATAILSELSKHHDKPFEPRHTIKSGSLIEEVMSLVTKLIKAQAYKLLFLDTSKHELYTTSSYCYMPGKGKARYPETQHYPINHVSGISGHVVQTGKSVKVPDAQVDVRFSKVV